VNLVSHAHGQGYADLNFLIPEIVQRIELFKGPYFVEYGDLANAGAVNIVTKDNVVENSVQALGGSFNTTRYSTAISPLLGPVKTLLAAEFYYSDGPFLSPNRYGRYNLFSNSLGSPRRIQSFHYGSHSTAEIGTVPDKSAAGDPRRTNRSLRRH